MKTRKDIDEIPYFQVLSDNKDPTHPRPALWRVLLFFIHFWWIYQGEGRGIRDLLFVRNDKRLRRRVLFLGRGDEKGFPSARGKSSVQPPSPKLDVGGWRWDRWKLVGFFERMKLLPFDLWKSGNFLLVHYIYRPSWGRWWWASLKGRSDIFGKLCFLTKRYMLLKNIEIKKNHDFLRPTGVYNASTKISKFSHCP